ncbi:MAG: hypothetical protein ACK41C_12810 [Phenylobacterium sp.]|uniref:hypothetical protein n=1 Tax=Phenylobacterium sp. TaxID=1871053 RepID=UPI00391C6027
MPSSYTPRLRLEQQAAGENLNTWGAPKLNNVIGRIDFAVAGWTVKTLTGDVTLTSSNTGDDEARAAVLKFTGAGTFTVTVPSVEKVYKVWNGCTGDLTVTTGAGASATLGPGEIATVLCDGVNVAPEGAGGVSIRAYAEGLAFAQVDLPAQAGNAGKFIHTDGSAASWKQVVTGDIGDYAADQAARAEAQSETLKAFAIAAAVAL